MPAPTTIVQNPTAVTRTYTYVPPHGLTLAAGATATLGFDLYSAVRSRRNARMLTALTNDETNNRIRIVAQPDVGPAPTDGTCPLATANAAVVERGNAVVHQTTLTLTNLSISTTDATTSGAYGGVKFYDFPECLLIVHHVAANLTFTRVGTNITATAGLKYSIGTAVEAANDTLDSTQANLLASTAATLAAGTSGAVAGKSTAQSAVFDGTATAVDAFLNVGVPDAGSTGNDAVTVSGTIVLTWSYGGDV